MSFIYGGTDVESLDGVCATLQTYYNHGGLNLSTQESPGVDGRFYGGAVRDVREFPYTVTISGEDPAQAEANRDAFVRLLDTSQGPRDLRLWVDDEWYWPEVILSSPLELERMQGGPGGKVHYQGSFTLATTRYASARLVEPLVSNAPYDGTYTLTEGNTVAYPAFEATLTGSTKRADVTIGDVTVEVDISALAQGDSFRLDWDQMRFSHLDANGDRVGSLVAGMSTFERPELQIGVPTSVTYFPASQLGDETLIPNPRRV